MTNQEKITYIESILELVYMDLYPTHSTIRKTGYNANWMRVLTSDLEEALELIAMNNLECEVKENPFYRGCTDITILLKKKKDLRPLWKN